MVTAETRLHIFTHIRCNNNCLFCLDHCRTDEMCVYEPGKTEISCGDLSAILERFRPETDKVLFTTGEPTLHPLLPDFIRLCVEKKFTEIGLITNGRMFAYEKFCEEILSAGLNRISVSIHGHTKRIHQAHTRVSGSFEQTVLGLHNLRSAAGRFRFTLNSSTTLTKINVDHVYDMIVFFGNFISDGQIILNPVIPIGAALKYHKNVMIGMSESAARIVEAKKRLADESSPLADRIFIMDIPRCVLAAASGSPSPRPSRERVIGGMKSDEINKVEIEVQPKIKRRQCASCAFDSSCEGVFTGYAGFFGWDEFKPVRQNNK